METMNIALPESLKEVVQQRVARAGYSSASEYVRELIQADQKEIQKASLEAQVLEGLASGQSVAMSKSDWERLRSEIRARPGRQALTGASPG